MKIEVYCNLGGISPDPSLIFSVASILSHFHLDQRVYHRKFGDSSYNRDQMHKEQTDKHSSLYRQMLASISHTHNQCENVTLGDRWSQNRSKFSKFLKNWRKLQFIIIWVKFHPTTTSVDRANPLSTFL